MIAIIDYDAGNIQSVYKALKYVGCDCIVTKDKNEIMDAQGAILPGVGSFGNSMENMNKNGLTETVREFIKTKKPFLGICLGLQLLFPESEESPNVKGIDIFKGTVTKIPDGDGLKIPHMGWNSIKLLKKDGIFKGIRDNSYVYFVHSYYLNAENKNIVAAQTQYGVTIDAAISYENVTATQFHPEKSGEVGLQMLRNFADMCKE
ncbi:MAG: imidazole glycerol phosphate synthase subunit HisH [Ruminococcus sp.]